MSESTTSRKGSKVRAEQMRAEYDFSRAVRGKYYKRYLENSNVVVLEPDVARHFKNAGAVNDALRSLITPSGTPRGQVRRPARTRRQVGRR